MIRGTCPFPTTTIAPEPHREINHLRTGAEMELGILLTPQLRHQSEALFLRFSLSVPDESLEHAVSRLRLLCECSAVPVPFLGPTNCATTT